jgi:hypothetical protein
MKTYDGVEILLHAFLNPALDEGGGGGQFHAPDPLTRGKEPRYIFHTGLDGPQSRSERYNE